jgi:putative tryptophan/tyrosine transport system substrate-binding protein
MRRRKFITFMGGAVAWPIAARAQQPAGKMPKIGFLQNTPSELVVAMMQSLSNAGYVKGRNVLLETRFYGGVLDRAVEFANELVALKCDVIFAAAPYAIQAAMRVTTTIPIVATDLESDLVASGWAKGLGSPGGNLTRLLP